MGNSLRKMDVRADWVCWRIDVLLFVVCGGLIFELLRTIVGAWS